MVITKLVPKRVVKIRRWPPKTPSTKYKIKPIVPEQKIVQRKKNGQVIRTITACRETTKFTDRWARKF